MEILTQIQGVLIGLIGWAATAVLTLGSLRLSTTEQRVMIVFCWTLWMIPALGTLVYQHLLEINTAALYCGTTTMLLGVLVSISSNRWHTKP